MRVPKRLLASEPVRRVLAAAAAGYMRIVHATSRWEVRGGDIPARFWDSGDPFIMGLWHGRLLMLFYCWRRGMPVRTLISHHRDGELLAQTMQRFGIGALRGSSSVDGAGALRDIVRTLKSGTSVCLAPDGPRGPRMRASAGVVAAARLSGVPVIPIAVGVTRRRLLASWDRFLLPLPFSRGVFVWGNPFLFRATPTRQRPPGPRRRSRPRSPT